MFLNTNRLESRPASELMKENMLVKHLAGSHAYGTALPTSDVDYRGIFCADPINYLTPFFTVKECEDQDEEDTKLYELGHFVKLCVDCNPNIVETLWVELKDVTHITPAYMHLRNNRQHFLSSKIAFTTSGYAMAQLKRIKGHNKWINNPQPKEPPQPKDYLSVVQWFGEEKNLKVDLNKYNEGHQLWHFGNNLFGVYPAKGTSLWNDKGSLKYDRDGETKLDRGTPLMVIKWNKEEYNTAKDRHTNYWRWKNNRNEARGELEEEFGYDTKHAMHLVRLMRMGKEALTEGKLIVKRPDADELLAIRNGAWEYDDLLKYAESMDKEIRENLYKNTPLRKRPNLHKVAEILMETQQHVWNGESKDQQT